MPVKKDKGPARLPGIIFKDPPYEQVTVGDDPLVYPTGDIPLTAPLPPHPYAPRDVYTTTASGTIPFDQIMADKSRDEILSSLRVMIQEYKSLLCVLREKVQEKETIEQNRTQLLADIRAIVKQEIANFFND